ncbi:MAG: phosphoglucomutase [Candidatus Tokpelaia sp. JSC161]|jgi:phosphoglucomutase|nr:MAG: phosphoglucomutase [Candidatus Tokpelaia sp. JSC161]
MHTVKTQPFFDQNPGTSGLRKKTKIFEKKNYAENFIQSIFDCAGPIRGKVLILGGDGRYLNKKIIQKVLKLAAGNGFSKVIVGKDGLLSTPAVSNLIRKHKAMGGIILSASHNPGGHDGDFGIKYNVENGGPAPDNLMRAIYDRSKKISRYFLAKEEDVSLVTLGIQIIAAMQVEIIDSVRDYADLMEELFDFTAIRHAIGRGFRFRFDAMHGVTGPYAHEIFERRLGFPSGTVVNGIPLADFGGKNPDPNLVYAKERYDMLDKGLDFAAASDGDGDRNLLIGKGIFVNPSDSLAILAANARLVKGYFSGIIGVARSMPTSTAVNYVADKHKFRVYETPTGWKFFSNLLDAGLVNLCGEESFGTSSSHIREKDGLWAILMWLNILAVTNKSVSDLVRLHWYTYGRNYYSRHDYEGVEEEVAERMINNLRMRLTDLRKTRIGNFLVKKADDFIYHDQIDNSVSVYQGIRILFQGARMIFRISGTGTEGATVRVYLEQYEADSAQHDKDTQTALSPLIRLSDEISGLKLSLKRSRPTVIT